MKRQPRAGAGVTRRVLAHAHSRGRAVSREEGSRVCVCAIQPPIGLLCVALGLCVRDLAAGQHDTCGDRAEEMYATEQTT